MSYTLACAVGAFSLTGQVATLGIRTNFYANGAGSPPAGWTARGTLTNYSANMEAVAGSVSGKDMLLKRTGVQAFTMMSWDQVVSHTDIEVLIQYRPLMGTGTDVFRLMLRADGTHANEYYFEVGDTNFSRVSKFVSSAFTNLAVTTPITWDSSNWYWTRFRAVGTALKVKSWLDGTTEPGTWDIEVTDSSLSSGNYAGPVVLRSAGEVKVGFFSAALGGLTAPGPGRVTNFSAGAFTVSGQTAALRTSLHVGAGSFLLTGRDANFAGRLIAERGIYTITGIAAGLLRSRLLRIDSGAFSFSGQAVVFGKGRIAAISHGAFTLAGYSAIFPLTRRLTAVPGAFTFTGRSIVVIYEKFGAGFFRLKGYGVFLAKRPYVPRGPARMILGRDNFGAHVLRVSRPGFDVLEHLTDAEKVFDSDWDRIENVWQAGSFGVTLSTSAGGTFGILLRFPALAFRPIVSLREISADGFSVYPDSWWTVNTGGTDPYALLWYWSVEPDQLVIHKVPCQTQNSSPNANGTFYFNYIIWNLPGEPV